jgi:carbon-monoxide dehydrogenase large subunit
VLRHNPLGVKGCGAVGTIASPATVMSAVVDALSPCGIAHLDMAATPERIWQTIQRARRPA